MYEIIPVILNTPEWLELRRQGIGGSDAAPALGLSKWTTPYQLYLDKIGEGEPVQENEPMYWGRTHEPNIIKRFRSDVDMIVDCPAAIYRSKINPFMQYTPDGLVINNYGTPTRLLEVKTSRHGYGFGEPGSDEIPQEYLLQVQHGLIVTGLPVCDVAVLIGGSEYRQYEISADKELQEMVIEQEAAFWEKVQKREEPEAVNEEDLKKRYRFSKAQAIQATADIATELEGLTLCKASIKGLEECESKLKAAIQSFMGENDTLEYFGKPVATWKSTKPGQKFDVDTFKQVYPEIYNKYLIETASQRRFLIK